MKTILNITRNKFTLYIDTAWFIGLGIMYDVDECDHGIQIGLPFFILTVQWKKKAQDEFNA